MSKETTDIKIEKLGMEAKPYDKVLAKVAELCPAAVQNGKVDFERLKAELADVVDENVRETYEFKWVGKNAAMVEANKPIRKTLRPCKEESKNWDATENLYIEGDNLEVLKLLEEGYLGKIKMIYIDPPYNTGNDFLYHDNRVQSEEEMNQGIDLFDEEDNRLLSKSFVRNTESSGRFHSDWCSMMYPRLKLARDLLTDDGVIFISIDDNEVANLKKICDEVFGEDNFIGIFVINSTPNARDYGHMGKMTEYALFYSKNANFTSTNMLPEVDKIFKYKDEKGGFNIHPLYNSNEAFNKFNRPNLYYPFYLYLDKKIGKDFYAIGLEKEKDSIEIFPPKSLKNNVSFVWRWGKEKAQCNLNEEIIGYKTENGEYRIVQKMRHTEKIIRSLLSDTSFTTRRGTAEVEEIFGDKYFSFPKPINLLKNFIIVGSESNSIILDFFSGSATTAHAVMQLNAEDGGNRKFIMVQLPEETDEKSEAYKAGYKNICEIGKERIRRAGDKIVQETGKTDLDIGFRVLKVDDSNMQDVYYKPSELKQADLLSSIDNIKADRTPLDLLFGVMVEWGVSLSLPLQEVKVGENIIHIVGDNDLVACFDKNVSTETITKMAELKPIRVVFRDSCFEKDDEKINMFEIFKTICHWDDKQAKDNVRVM